jgi:hypothetical protein
VTERDLNMICMVKSFRQDWKAYANRHRWKNDGVVRLLLLASR